MENPLRMATGKDLRLLIKASGKTVEEAAVILETTRQTLHTYFGKADIEDTYLQKVKSLLNVSLPILSEPEVEAYGKEDTQNKKYTDGRRVSEDLIEIKVPLVQAFAYGGYLSGYGDAEYLETLPYLTMTADKERRGNYVAFEVRNDSMSAPSGKTFNEGDRVIGREIPLQYWRNKFHMKQWRFFVIVTKTDGILIKEMIAHDTTTGKIKLHSLNPEYKDFEVNLDEVAQIFNVVERREKM